MEIEVVLGEAEVEVLEVEEVAIEEAISNKTVH